MRSFDYQTAIGRYEGPMLPLDLWVECFQFLSLSDLLNASETCSVWFIISSDYRLWKPIHQQRFGIPSTKTLVSASSGANEKSLISWKRSYISHQKVEYHTKRLDYSFFETKPSNIQNEEEHPILTVKLEGDICYAGYNSRIVKWDLNKRKWFESLEIPFGELSKRCLQVDEEKVVAGTISGASKRVFLWKGNSAVALGPKDDIIAMQYLNNQLVCGVFKPDDPESGLQNSSVIQLWDMQTDCLIYDIVPNLSRSPLSLQFDEHKLIFGTKEAFEIWDIRSKTPALRYEYNVRESIQEFQAIIDLQFDNNKLAVASGQWVDVFDLRQLEIPLFTISHTRNTFVKSIQFDQYKIISEGADRTLRVHNVNNGKLISLMPTVFTKPVSCFCFDWSKIILGHDDGTLQTLNLTTRNIHSFSGTLKSKRGIPMSDLFVDSMSRINTPTFISTNEQRNKFTSDMKRLLNNSEEFFADVVFEVEGKRITGHGNILSTRSPKFKELIAQNAGNDLIVIDNIPHDVFTSIIDFCYHENCDIPDNPMELLRLAHEFGLPSLVAKCEQELGDTITTDNVISLIKEATQIGAAQLLNKCFHFILANYQTISQQSQFMQLPKEILVELIQIVRKNFLYQQ